MPGWRDRYPRCILPANTNAERVVHGPARYGGLSRVLSWAIALLDALPPFGWTAPGPDARTVRGAAQASRARRPVNRPGNRVSPDLHPGVNAGATTAAPTRPVNGPRRPSRLAAAEPAIRGVCGLSPAGPFWSTDSRFSVLGGRGSPSSARTGPLPPVGDPASENRADCQRAKRVDPARLDSTRTDGPISSASPRRLFPDLLQGIL